MTHLGHQLTENVKLLHKAVLIVNDKALILKRALDAKSRPGCWDLPGGNSEWPAETQASAPDLHQQDVAREIEEETGVKADPQHFDFKSLVYLSTYFDSQKQIYTVIFGWKAPEQLISKSDSDFAPQDNFPQIEISPEHSEFFWVSLDQLDNYDFGGVKGQFVVDIIKAAFKEV